MTGPDHEDEDDGERKAQTLRDFERWCAGAGGMRVAGGESLAGPAHAWEILARENLFTALMADIVFVGGISELRRVGDLSAARGVEYSPHCPWGPVALTASVHAMAAVPNCEIHGTPPPDCRPVGPRVVNTTGCCAPGQRWRMASATSAPSSPCRRSPSGWWVGE